ncbi:MAG: TonB-dependent receptor, partial [Bacteroidota bacterium]
MRSLILSVLLLTYVTLSSAGTTGKIAGTMTDARTGEKLISANVVVVGTSAGAATNVEGYFVILNLPPGRYTLRASLLGYATATISNVVVEIDQTTNIPINISEEVMQGEEVTIVAERPVIQQDLSASRANITAAEVVAIPTNSLASVVALQAGVVQNASGDLVIRGGGADQTAFLLNGQSLRSGRSNTSFTAISLSSIDNVQITTGGFTAEYGNVRSGVVNAVTKEGNTTGYSFSITARYRPAAPKHFGPSIYDRNSFFIRPYIDPDVSWTGTTNGTWDEYTQKQFQPFIGWNAISQKTLSDNDPNNDLTPQAAQQLFLWQHRKQADTKTLFGHPQWG